MVGSVTIHIEAESGQTGGSWAVKTVRDAGVDRFRHIQTNQDRAELRFEIHLPKSGGYHLWVREGVRRHTSIYSVLVDGADVADVTQYKADARPKEFRWNRVLHGKPIEKGKHVLALRNMEPKPISFDRLIITDDEQFRPVGFLPEQPRPQVSRDGERPTFSDGVV